MIDHPRPDNDDELIEIGELDQPSQEGASGGEPKRERGAIDEEKSDEGQDEDPPQRT